MSASRFLLQMHGLPGTGKSTLAGAIGRETGAVVLDKDVVKSRILLGDAMGLAGLPEQIAAPLHHALMFDLVGAVLAQGFSVVLDGAAFFPVIVERGKALAETVGAAYFLIECTLPDVEMRQARIDRKDRMASHVRLADQESGYGRPGTAPPTVTHLSLDTRRPFEEYLAEALAYVRGGQP